MCVVVAKRIHISDDGRGRNFGFVEDEQTAVPRGGDVTVVTAARDARPACVHRGHNLDESLSGRKISPFAIFFGVQNRSFWERENA